MSDGFNLSDWALRHRSLVWFAIVALAVAGFGSYFALGRAEDPSFTVKTMVVQVAWPGASITDTIEQVTDRIEHDRFPFACALGGPDGRTLFMLCAEWRGLEGLESALADRTGQVLVAEAPAPHGGWP